jgi:hypothetical protein
MLLKIRQAVCFLLANGAGLLHSSVNILSIIGNELHVKLHSINVGGVRQDSFNVKNPSEAIIMNTVISDKERISFFTRNEKDIQDGKE